MTTKAIVFVSKGKAVIQDVPAPKLRDDYILVKVKAVGLNPTDWKHIDKAITKEGGHLGCDYAGIVEEVGPKVTKPFQVGDRIAGFVHGGDELQLENGAFAERTVVKGDLQIKIPDNLSDEEAATLGVSVTTVGQGLYKSLGLPLPPAPSKSPQESILIYGGSTATGTFGIQFAKLSGFRVITTSSPRHFDYLRSLGADAVLDYRSPTCGADIRALTHNGLRLAWDCTGSGAAICAAALSDDEQGGRYGTILTVPREALTAVNPRVEGPFNTLGYTIFGERVVKLGNELPAREDEFEFGKKFSELSTGLLRDGKVKTVRPIVNQGGKGLEGVLVGLDELRQGKVSGGKLVYTL